jgi:hypothetical protein
MKSRILLLLGISLVAGCAIDPTGGLGPSSVPSEKWVVDFGTERWKLGSSEANHVMRVIEYVPEGQSVDAWKELVTDGFVAGRFETTTKFIQISAQSLSRRVDGFQSKVIYDTGAEALWEWWHADSGQWPAEDQLEVVKYYPTGILTLAYVRKGPPMSDDEKERWIERLKNAKLR